jgi:hypothetical protein
MATLDDAIRRLNAVPAVMAIELRTALQASLLLIEKDARELAPRDQRRLAASISNTIVGRGLALEGRVGPSVGYGTYVEFGRRAGSRMPPVEALIPWVRRHWRPAQVGPQRVLLGVERELSGRIDNNRHVSARTADRLIYRRAFGLARAIQRRGIPPNPFMRPAYNRNRVAIYERFGLLGQRVAASIAGQPL